MPSIRHQVGTKTRRNDPSNAHLDEESDVFDPKPRDVRQNRVMAPSKTTLKRNKVITKKVQNQFGPDDEGSDSSGWPEEDSSSVFQ